MRAERLGHLINISSGVKFLNSLCSLRTSSPDSIVLALGVAKTYLRLALRHESKAVCFLKQNTALKSGVLFYLSAR